MKHFLYFFLSALCLFACTSVNPPEKGDLTDATGALPLDRIKLPEGFKIEIFADSVVNARSLALSEAGTLFVGTRSHGSVYALRDTDGDNKVDEKFVLLEGGNMPNGVALKDGDLYVAEVNRILRFRDIENRLEDPGTPEVVYDQYPEISHHGWKYISFGPDGKLYVPVGAPCNICESKERIFNTITRINPDGTDLEIVQEGVRNTVGFTWHPESGELWFTDNGRDMLGDDLPACELNKATGDFQHFGYPYCHQGDLQDPDFGKKYPCDNFIPPVQNLGPHTAPLGVEFYTAENFPSSYKGQVLIAEHGSWNRTKKIGYRVTLVTINDQHESTGYTVFADGWLDETTDEAWGRPVDLEFLPDGSMLVSDDFADVIYRIYYEG